MLLKEKHKLLRLLIIYVSISLLLLIFRAGRIVEVGRSLSLYLLAPNPRIVSKLLSETGRIGERISHLVSAREENRILKEKITSLLQEREELRETISEIKRLKRILNYQEEAPYEVVSARVVGWTPSLFSSALLVDKGTKQGFEKDTPVVAWQEGRNSQENGMAVVGRISDCGPDMSKVLLITDTNSELAAMVQRSREKGVIAGTGERALLLKYLSPTADLGIGDLIITSGMGRTFPAGLVIGSVEEVLTGVGGLERQARVVPRVNINQLEDVQIIKK
ncbi:MAG: rod shape-determining protein MreC [Elusimicrobiota bacterium]|nr:rod shape-determining protein MreC [Elusimicrobiota bacterium]